MLCAVSGGKDSMYLLEKLMELSAQFGFSVAAAHFDHRLRGAESDRDRQFVQNYCQKRGVPCYIGSGDVAQYAKDGGLGLEEAARHLRYEFLEKTAEEIGAVRIATAHTAEDNAETLLLNLCRGSALGGLCAIPPVRGKIIRPMLETGTDEVLSYLEENKIPHVEDSTNGEDCFARNRIRHSVLPLLRQENSAFGKNVRRCISLLREDEDYLTRLAQDYIDENFSDGGLSADSFAQLPGPVSARVLIVITKGRLSLTHIDAIRALAASKDPHCSTQIPGGIVRREYDRLLFSSAESVSISPAKLEMGKTTAFLQAGFEISCKFIPHCCEIHNSFNIFSFKSDSICGSITVKSRCDGDKIRLNGRKCTKSLKQLFSEARLNGEGRGRVPVLWDEAGIVAVGGFGIAERCCPAEGDDIILAEIRPLSL